MVNGVACHPNSGNLYPNGSLVYADAGNLRHDALIEPQQYGYAND